MTAGRIRIPVVMNTFVLSMAIVLAGSIYMGCDNYGALRTVLARLDPESLTWTDLDDCDVDIERHAASNATLPLFIFKKIILNIEHEWLNS